MKRFLIHCSTEWCGMDDTFRAVAEKEEDLWELADQLAYENFQMYGGIDLILEDYDTENMTEEEIEAIVEEIDESLMNEIIPVNGSMPAFLYYFVEAYIDDATSYGIPYEVASSIYASTK